MQYQSRCEIRQYPRCVGIAWNGETTAKETRWDDVREDTYTQVIWRDPRYMIADMDPLQQDRSTVSGAHWNPYNYFDNRSLHTQMLATNLRDDGDPYTQRIGPFQAFKSPLGPRMRTGKCMPSHVKF